jgi:NAD(P)-dependent dehydrogenase (short-subunit alcohol dehydrogenase family)
MPRTVLILGGYGSFGARLCRRLQQFADLRVVIAGRAHEPAQSLANALNRPGGAVFEACVLDVADLPARIGALAPWLVVNTVGPFQGSDYRIARTAIGAGAHYIDIADGRDFIAGFATLDALAKQHGVVAIAGASSTPAISSAAADLLAGQFSAIDDIEVTILPGNRAPRGLAVIRALLSYVGRPVRVFIDGAWRERPGWGLQARAALPGIGARRAGLCETPDLDVLHARYRPRRSAIFRAGLELAALHRGLGCIALLVRLGAVRDPSRLAPALRWLANLLDRCGTDRGGMCVKLSGVDPAGSALTARWYLVAEAGDGPSVPIVPVVALIRRMLAGDLPAQGAAACVGLLPLAAIDAELRGLRITTRHGPDLPQSLSPHRRILRSAFDQVAPAIRHFHEHPGATHAGSARIDGGVNPLARLARLLFGLPKPGGDVPVTVTMTAAQDGHHWVRNFAGRVFASRFITEPDGALLVEHTGPMRFGFHLTVENGCIVMAFRRWWLWRLPLPAALGPRVTASEGVDEQGRYRFDVQVALPIIGDLVSYRGFLSPRDT